MPPTQMWTEPWMPLMGAVKVAYVVLAMADDVPEAIAASPPSDAGARMTLIVRVGVWTVGSTPTSQSGKCCSSALVQSQ